MPRWLIVVLVILAVFAGYAVIQRANPTVLRASIEINATPQQVWAVLTDLDSYAAWNPFIIESSGDVKVGSTLHNTMHDVTGDRVFTPEVLVADPGRELRWSGRLWGWGFFDGEHSFVIDEVAPGRVQLTQSEVFRGILVPVLASSLHKNTQPQFVAMNEALAERVAA